MSGYDMPITTQAIEVHPSGRQICSERRGGKTIRVVVPPGLRVEIGDTVTYSRSWGLPVEYAMYTINGVDRYALIFERADPPDIPWMVR